MNPKGLDLLELELIALDYEMKEKKILSDPAVIEAYQTRFPTCVHPKKKIYEDGSSHFACKMGAFGEEHQQPSEIPWPTCLNCTCYQSKKK